MEGVTSDGITFEVFPIGCKVRHKEHPELIGVIRTHEYCKGNYSALPYTVEWDNSDLSHQLLGILPIWPRLESLEIIQ